MQARKKKIEYTFELYLNAGGRIVFGKTGAQILEAVEEHGSMVMAAKKLEMSYRFTWNYLSRMRKELHQPVVVTRRGGTSSAKKKGGGGTTLTPTARALLKEFRETERLMRQILSNREVPALISAPNFQRK